LSSRENQPPAASIMDQTRMPEERDCGCTEKSTGTQRCSQRLASRRVTPIKPASETTKRMAAAVNAGGRTGEKAGTLTSVWRMAKTFYKMSWFWKNDSRDDQSCPLAGLHLSDLHADICSPQDTRSTMMPSIPGSPASPSARVLCRHARIRLFALPTTGSDNA
jgi:hypothetical protein